MKGVGICDVIHDNRHCGVPYVGGYERPKVEKLNMTRDLKL
jgi:hypothetical protein